MNMKIITLLNLLIFPPVRGELVELYEPFRQAQGERQEDNLTKW